MKKHVAIILIVTLLILALGTLCACGPTGNQTGDVKVTSIDLERRALTLTVGDSFALSYTISPSNATNKNVTWSSSNSSVASVSQNGIVTANAKGDALITVTTEDGNFKANCTVAVNAKSEGGGNNSGGNGGNNSGNNGGSNNGGNNTNPANAPKYLGILATSSAPSQTDPYDFGKKSARKAQSAVDYESAIMSYYANGQNSLGENMPIDDGCDLCTTPGSMVYIQLWFDNPDSCTILSLRLNGVKYQVGGQLRSYFYANGSNCVFVEVPIPTTATISETYTVTEVQYVEESNAISGNGTELFLGDSDTSVKIGFPYAQEPWAYFNEGSDIVDYHTFSIQAMVIDDASVLTTANGIVRAVVFKGNEIVAQQKMTRGRTDLSFTGLIEGAKYKLVVFAMYDKHDGNGLSVTILTSHDFETTKVVNLNATSSIYDFDDGHKGVEIVLTGDFSAQNQINSLKVVSSNGVVVYTATSSEVETLNSTKSLTIRDRAVLNNNDYDIALTYGDSSHDASVSIHTSALLIPNFVDSAELQVGDNRYYLISALDDCDNPINDYTGLAYFSTLNELDENYVSINSLDSFTTTNMLLKELAIVKNAQFASIENLVIRAYDENDLTRSNPIFTLQGDDVLIYAGDSNIRVRSEYYIDYFNDGGYVNEDVNRDAHRYYLMLNNWDELREKNYHYYAEFIVDLNDGKGAQSIRMLIHHPSNNKNEYDIDSQLNHNTDALGEYFGRYYVVGGQYNNTVTLYYTAAHYPTEFYLATIGGVKDSNDMWVDLSPNIISWNPVAVIDASQYLYTDWPYRAEIECDKTDANFENFRFVMYNSCTYFYKSGVVNVRNVRGQSAEYCLSKEPIFTMPNDEIAKLSVEIDTLAQKWNEDYLAQIKQGEYFDIVEVLAPNFFEYHTKEITIDLSKYPQGNYALAVDNGYSGLEWNDKCSFTKSAFPGEFGSCSIIGGVDLYKCDDSLAPAQNLRIEDGNIFWDAVEGADKYVLQFTYVKNNVLYVDEINVNAQYNSPLKSKLESLLADIGVEDIKVSLWANAEVQKYVLREQTADETALYAYYVDKLSSVTSINCSYIDGVLTIKE